MREREKKREKFFVWVREFKKKVVIGVFFGVEKIKNFYFCFYFL